MLVAEHESLVTQVEKLADPQYRSDNNKEDRLSNLSYGNLLGHCLAFRFMVALHPSLFPFLLWHLRSQVPVQGYLHRRRVLRIRRTALLGPSSPLSRSWLP